MLTDDAAAAAAAEDRDEVTSPIQGGQQRTEAVLMPLMPTLGMSKCRGPGGEYAFGLDW